MGTPSFRRSSPGDFTLPKRRKSVNSRYESALLGKSRSNMSPAFSTIAADSPRRVSACRTSSVLRISTRGPSCSLHPERDRSGSCVIHSENSFVDGVACSHLWLEHAEQLHAMEQKDLASSVIANLCAFFGGWGSCRRCCQAIIRHRSTRGAASRFTFALIRRGSQMSMHMAPWGLTPE